MRTTIVFFCALVLEFAGLAKLVTTAPELGEGSLFEFPSTLLFWIALFEIGVGFWLVADYRRRHAIIVALLFFGAAFCWTAFNIATGQKTCSCFGAFRSSTYFAAGISLGCGTGLASVSSVYSSTLSQRKPDRSLIFWGGWLFSILGGGLLVASFAQGVIGVDTLNKLVDRLDQKSLTAAIKNSTVRAVDYFEGFSETFDIEIHNSSTKAVELVGYTFGGQPPGSVSARGLPMTALPHTTIRIALTVFRPPLPTEFAEDALHKYLTSSRVLEHQYRVAIRILTNSDAQPSVDVFAGFRPSTEFLKRLKAAELSVLQ